MQARTPLHSGMTAEEAFIVVALDAADDFVTHLEATMKDDDPHGPHQARVALRRLRTMLKAYEPILDRDFVDDLKDESRRLFLQLGHIRDADIRLAAAETDAERSDRQKAAMEVRDSSRKKLSRDDADEFADRLEARLEKKGWKADSKKARTWRKSPIAVLASNALDRAWDDIQPEEPLEDMSDRTLHNLRKDVKAMRYMAEFFGPVMDRGDWRASLDGLKALQDKLGELTDMALSGKQDNSSRPDLVRDAAGLVSRIISLGTWWRIDGDLAED